MPKRIKLDDLLLDERNYRFPFSMSDKSEEAIIKYLLVNEEGKKIVESINSFGYDKEIKQMEHELLHYGHLRGQASMSLISLLKLMDNAVELFEISKSDQKRCLMKIIFSKLRLSGKSVIISMRKPIAELSFLGPCPEWLNVLDRVKTEYQDELADLWVMLKDFDVDVNTPESIMDVELQEE